MDEIILSADKWAAIIAVILGALGLFIANLFQAIKTRAEAHKTRAETGEIMKHQKEVLDQFKNNGGSTMKDATDRIEQNLKDVSGRLEASLRTIRCELAFQRRETLRLAEVDDQDRELANEIYKDMRRLMGNLDQDLKRHIEDVPNVISKEYILETLNEEKEG